MRNAGMTSDTQVESVENGQVGVVETEEDGFGPCAARELAGGAKTDLLQVTRTGKLQNFRRPQQPLSNGKIVLFGVLHYSTADAVLAAPAGSAASQRHTCSHAEKAARTPQTPLKPNSFPLQLLSGFGVNIRFNSALTILLASKERLMGSLFDAFGRLVRALGIADTTRVLPVAVQTSILG